MGDRRVTAPIKQDLRPFQLADRAFSARQQRRKPDALLTAQLNLVSYIHRQDEFELLTAAASGRYHDSPSFRDHGSGLPAAASASSEIIIGNL